MRDILYRITDIPNAITPSYDHDLELQITVFNMALHLYPLNHTTILKQYSLYRP